MKKNISDIETLETSLDASLVKIRKNFQEVTNKYKTELRELMKIIKRQSSLENQLIKMEGETNKKINETNNSLSDLRAELLQKVKEMGDVFEARMREITSSYSRVIDSLKNAIAEQEMKKQESEIKTEALINELEAKITDLAKKQTKHAKAIKLEYQHLKKLEKKLELAMKKLDMKITGLAKRI